MCKSRCKPLRKLYLSASSYVNVTIWNSSFEAQPFNLSTNYSAHRKSPVKPRSLMDPLQLAVTWYKIRHAGEQAVHWDIQNKATSSRQICIFFVLDVPVRSLFSSMADFVPCDRQLQRAHCSRLGVKIFLISPSVPSLY